MVVGLLAEPLARHPRMREEDIVMVQLVITFLRFVCACVCGFCVGPSLLCAAAEAGV